MRVPLHSRALPPDNPLGPGSIWLSSGVGGCALLAPPCGVNAVDVEGTELPMYGKDPGANWTGVERGAELSPPPTFGRLAFCRWFWNHICTLRALRPI